MAFNEDPLVAKLRQPRYASMSDQEAADAINAERVGYRRPASTADVKAYSIREGFWADIDEGCDSADGFTRRVCRNVRAYIEDAAGKLPTVDLDSVGSQQWILALCSLSMLTEQQRNGLLALGDASMSWPESVGLPTLGVGLVINARKVIASTEVSADAQ